MKYPDIKTYRENIRQHYISPVKDRPHFLGQTALDTRWKKSTPAMNVRKDDTIYTLEIALPGFSKECIDVTLHEDVLSIRAEKKSESRPFPESEYLIQEFDHDVVERTLKLGKGIGYEKIEAKYQNGILEISFHEVPKEDKENIKRVIVD